MEPRELELNRFRHMWRTLPQPWRLKVRHYIHPALLARVGRAMPTVDRASDLGVLSVVIPVYNVQQYLEACLRSVTEQTYRNLDIVIVDDGSSDGSLKIARGFARVDSRITIVRQLNAGLGAARNAGIRRSRGQFIAFADSDDIVPRGAYTTMMASLNSSESDFVVGSINRLTGKRRDVPKWAKQVHAIDRHRIQLQDFPEILQNVFAWNKVFRRSFWNESVGEFPEGVLYEDQETMGRAYLRAAAFDVLSDVVYDWRIRQDRTSITQQKDDIRDLRDRLKVSLRMYDLMANEASSEILESWLAKILGPDLTQYYNQIPRVGEEYWSLLHEGIKELAQYASNGVFSRMDVHQRIMVNLVVAGQRDDLETVVVRLSEEGPSYPLTVEGSSLVASPGYLGDLKTPVASGMLIVPPDQLKMRNRLTKVTESKDFGIVFEGYAYIPGLDMDEVESELTAELVDKETGNAVRLPVERFVSPAVDQTSNHAWSSAANSAFRIEVAPGQIDDLAVNGDANSEWYILLSLNFGSFRVKERFTGRDMSGGAGSFPLLPVVNDSRYICRFSQDLGVSFLRVHYRRFVKAAVVDDRSVALTVEVAPGESAVHLQIECSALHLVETVAPTSSTEKAVHFDVTLPALPEGTNVTKQHIWKIRVATKDKKLHHLAWPFSLDALENASDEREGLRVRTTGYGYVELYDRRWQVVARSVSVSLDEARIVIEGSAGFVDRNPVRLTLPKLILANGRSVLRPKRISWNQENDSYSAEFDIAPVQWGNALRAPESGLYTLRCLTAPSGGDEGAYWVPVTRSLQMELPSENLGSDVRVRISRTPSAAALAVQFGAPYDNEERGRLKQGHLQRSIPALMSSSVEDDAVLFETFGGKSVSDSGLSLHKEMMIRGDTRPKYWSIRDHSVPIPDGGIGLVMYSKDWYRVLHSAEYVVNNNNFPFYYRKNPGQKYVQTWHGTPLKQIGNDVPSSTLSLSYIELMKREATYWDFLLAQNDFAQDVLPTAFGYDGRVLTLGYPRNDGLVGPPATDRRADVRRALGIADGKKAVLYAPTWRDNVRNSSNQYDLANHFDYDLAQRFLGNDYVFLMRGHHNIAGQRFTTGQSAFVDVTAYPNVNDLYLASDILVTDYSSVMFDFCVTGKPMYFLTPDLEEYRDSVRGFYFDFESSAPGPLMRNTQDLVEAIRSNESGRHFAEKYAAFTDRFASLDDGGASARVYDAIWGG